MTRTTLTPMRSSTSTKAAYTTARRNIVRNIRTRSPASVPIRRFMGRCPPVPASSGPGARGGRRRPTGCGLPCLEHRDRFLQGRVLAGDHQAGRDDIGGGQLLAATPDERDRLREPRPEGGLVALADRLGQAAVQLVEGGSVRCRDPVLVPA